jgi:hypothetical protein
VRYEHFGTLDTHKSTGRQSTTRYNKFIDFFKNMLKNVSNFLKFTVIGALIGKQKGRSLEIMNSFELMFTVIDDIIIDRDYYNTKEEQCKMH